MAGKKIGKRSQVATGLPHARANVRPPFLAVQPIEDPYGKRRLGIELETTIDRRAFGIDWNAELPAGGQVLANDVQLTARLELVQEA